MVDYTIPGLTAIAGALADNTEQEAHRNGQASSEKFTGLDLKNYLHWMPRHAGYVVGNWYMPDGVGSAASPVVGGIDSMRFFPFFITHKATISDLAVRVGTLQAGQNVQAAVYGSHATTKKPTGTVLANTGNISAAASGTISGALGASYQLLPGTLYWFATNASHAGILLASINSAITAASQILGTSTLANIIVTSGQTLTGLSSPQTFGTWPDVTAATFTDQVTASIPVVCFKVSSIT